MFLKRALVRSLVREILFLATAFFLWFFFIMPSSHVLSVPPRPLPPPPLSPHILFCVLSSTDLSVRFRLTTYQCPFVSLPICVLWSQVLSVSLCLTSYLCPFVSRPICIPSSHVLSESLQLTSYLCPFISCPIYVPSSHVLSVSLHLMSHVSPFKPHVLSAVYLILVV